MSDATIHGPWGVIQADHDVVYPPDRTGAPTPTVVGTSYTLNGEPISREQAEELVRSLQP